MRWDVRTQGLLPSGPAEVMLNGRHAPNVYFFDTEAGFVEGFAPNADGKAYLDRFTGDAARYRGEGKVELITKEIK